MLPRIAEEKDSPTSTSESTTPGFMQTIAEHHEGGDDPMFCATREKSTERDRQMDTGSPSMGATTAGTKDAGNKTKCNESSK